jgi:hypothetical protein
MISKDKTLEIIWEPQASPEAEDRLLAAFEMLFENVAIDIPEDQAI